MVNSMNIYDISKEAGVSIATVSRVLNKEKNVSPKTRAKIQAIIDANNYSATKPGKKRRPNKTVGLVCTNLTYLKTAYIVESLTSNLNKLGYHVMLSCNDNLADKKLALARLSDSNPTAIIIEGTDYLSYDNADNDFVLQTANNIPIIILNGFLDHPNIYTIFCDEGSLIFSLTEEFIKQNLTDVLFLFSSLSSYSTPLINSFNHAYYVHNVDTKPWQVKLCKRNYEDAFQYVDNLIKSGTNIDAVIAADDIVAAAAKKATDGNITVIGMGNTQLSELMNFSSIIRKENEIIDATLNTFKGIINKSHLPSRVSFQAELKKR